MRAAIEGDEVETEVEGDGEGVGGELVSRRRCSREAGDLIGEVRQRSSDPKE